MKINHKQLLHGELVKTAVIQDKQFTAAHGESATSMNERKEVFLNIQRTAGQIKCNHPGGTEMDAEM